MSAEVMFAAITFFAMSNVAAEFVWTTETLFTASCEGQDKELIWNFSKGENDTIIQLQWYYNKTMLICYHSESKGFRVTPLYQGRVERLEKAGIVLKNLSLNDAGEYTLYPKLVEEETENVQTIFLTVYETPTRDCKPTITIHSRQFLFCSVKSCGRQQLFIEWRDLKIRDPLGNDNNLRINSSWKYEYLLCCPQGPSMNCYKRNKTELCAATSDFSTGEDSSGITRPDISAQASKDTEDKVHVSVWLTIIISVTFVGIFIGATFIWYRRRIRRLETTLCQNAKMDENGSMELHALQTENTKLKSQLHCLEDSLPFQKRQKVNDACCEVTTMVHSDNSDDDTDMSNGTAQYEDAVSELSSNSCNTGD